MERQETLEEKLKHSEKEFREQFDPQSDKFHGGVSQPVPLGGARIPQSMPQQYPQNFNPGEVAPTSQQLGPEYVKLQKQRQILTSLKKVLAKQAPYVEAVYRHNEQFREKADRTNPQHVEKHKVNIEKEEKELAEVNKQLLQISESLQALGPDYKETEREIELIVKDSNKHYETKEQLTDFGFRNKKVSTKAFSDAQKLLDAMKKIKKAYKKPVPPAAEEAKKE